MPVERTTAAEHLERRVRDLRGYALTLTCHEGCTRPGSVRLAEHVRAHGHLQLAAFVRRLKCRWCKRAPARVELYDDPRATGEPSTVRVVLR